MAVRDTNHKDCIVKAIRAECSCNSVVKILTLAQNFDRARFGDLNDFCIHEKTALKQRLKSTYESKSQGIRV